MRVPVAMRSVPQCSFNVIHQMTRIMLAIPRRIAAITTAATLLVAALATCTGPTSQTHDNAHNHPPRPIPPQQRDAFTRGRALYAVSCAACHQPDGRGMEGVGPPLLDSPWLAGSADRLARIVLHGVRGPIRVGDTTYNLEMPALAYFTNEEIAAILTYARLAFTNTASAIEPGEVGAIREATEGRGDSWTVEELLQWP